MARLAHELVAMGASNAVIVVLLAAGVWLATRWIRRPAIVHAAWLLVLLKFVAPAAIALPWPHWISSDASLPRNRDPDSVANVNVPPMAAATSHDAVQPSAPPATESQATSPELAHLQTKTADVHAPAAQRPTELRLPEWTTLLAIAYLLGTAIWTCVLVLRQRRIRWLLARTREASDEPAAELKALANQIGLQKSPELRLIDAVIPPFVLAGVRRPVLIFPDRLFNQLTAEQRRMVMAHELAHLDRRDHLVRCLELVVSAFYWWHPVFWVTQHRLRMAAEQCCDRAVLEWFPSGVHAYAEALLLAVDFVGTRPPVGLVSAMAFSSATSFTRRMKMILERPRAVKRSRAALGAIALLALFVLPVSLANVWAEPKPGNVDLPAKSAPEKASSAPAATDPPKPHELNNDIVKAIAIGLRPIDMTQVTDKEMEEESHRLMLMPSDKQRPMYSSISIRKGTQPERQKLVKLAHRLENAARLCRDCQERARAAQQELSKIDADYHAGRATIDLLLDAQRRVVMAEAESDRLTQITMEGLQVYARKHTQIQRVYAALAAYERAWKLQEETSTDPKQISLAKLDSPVRRNLFDAEQQLSSAMSACLSDPLAEQRY